MTPKEELDVVVRYEIVKKKLAQQGITVSPIVTEHEIDKRTFSINVPIVSSWSNSGRFTVTNFNSIDELNAYLQGFLMRDIAMNGASVGDIARSPRFIITDKEFSCTPVKICTQTVSSLNIWEAVPMLVQDIFNQELVQTNNDNKYLLRVHTPITVVTEVALDSKKQNMHAYEIIWLEKIKNE